LVRNSYFLELVTFPDGIIAWPGPLFLLVRTITGIARIHSKHKAWETWRPLVAYSGRASPKLGKRRRAKLMICVTTQCC